MDHEDALKKSALGYTMTLRKPIKLREEKQKAGEGKIVTERIQYVDEEVYYPPNITAIIFYLKNRDPEHWRDKPKELENISDDPLNELFKRLDEECKADIEQETAPKQEGQETDGGENAEGNNAEKTTNS